MNALSFCKHAMGFTGMFLYTAGILQAFTRPGAIWLNGVAGGVMCLLLASIMSVPPVATSRVPKLGRVILDRVLYPHEDCGDCEAPLHEQFLDCSFHDSTCRVVVCTQCGTVFEHLVGASIERQGEHA